jgi:hypothetical protein
MTYMFVRKAGTKNGNIIQGNPSLVKAKIERKKQTTVPDSPDRLLNQPLAETVVPKNLKPGCGPKN